MITEFTLKFGDLRIQQLEVPSTGRTFIIADFHRMTPEKFDAMVDTFGAEKVDTLSVDGRAFRTAKIDFGGLEITMFADVPEQEVDKDQLSLLDGLTS